MHLEDAPRTPDRVDRPTLIVINLLLAVVLAALVLGPQVFFYVALALVPCALTMMIALTRGYGQPPL